MTIDIILATYNGEKFLKEQILSILNQSYKNIRLLIRDDGSSDESKNIILDLCNKDNRIIFIDDNIPPNGVGENFKILLQHCTSDYVMISDQDDIWNNQKIEKLLRFAEKEFTPLLPCIAYSPGIVTDTNLNVTNQLTSYSLKVKKVNDMILMNGGVQGCAMIINKCLYKRALKENIFWHMHDQVLTLYAICFGSIYFYNEPLFFYRQHGNNVLGFNNNNISHWFNKYIKNRKGNFLISKHSDNLFTMFLSKEKNNLKKETITLINKYNRCKKSKILFFIFILNNRITLRNSKLTSLFKLILAKELIEQ
ncbi:glycosyltransferase [Proteus mirabilis]|uniref:glycosyltransferase n=1 Tax=Morganellaceae TaxID=1903414 RepID=UPI0018C5E54E|nr:glycosyltransferase [Providencia manganoxydans]EJD6393829.1 glycosyltransferase [Proteus mirabilis]MBG6001326.1 glycosyltransferase [Proteus mirabilis]MDX4946835.1 glycosyltransferase [Providencia manganoxydans]